MIGALMAIAVIAAVVAVALRRRAQRQRISNQPGGSMADAIVVERFDEIDVAVQHHRCAWCGGFSSPAGEASQTVGDKRFRIVRLVCHECERDHKMHFDVTAIFH
jgi:hypothetical protein